MTAKINITMPSTKVKFPKAPSVLATILISMFKVCHDFASLNTRSWKKRSAMRKLFLLMNTFSTLNIGLSILYTKLQYVWFQLKGSCLVSLRSTRWFTIKMWGTILNVGKSWWLSEHSWFAWISRYDLYILLSNKNKFKRSIVTALHIFRMLNVSFISTHTMLTISLRKHPLIYDMISLISSDITISKKTITTRYIAYDYWRGTLS